MTETEFRFKHSQIIEYYQLIEMRLKGICSAILSDNIHDWFERLDDYESDPLGRHNKKKQEIQSQEDREYLSEEDIKRLDRIRQSRNYWCHQCFGSDRLVTVTIKNGNVKRQMHVERIIADLQEAIDCDEKLAELFSQIIKPVRNGENTKNV